MDFEMRLQGAITVRDKSDIAGIYASGANALFMAEAGKRKGSHTRFDPRLIEIRLDRFEQGMALRGSELCKANMAKCKPSGHEGASYWNFESKSLMHEVGWEQRMRKIQSGAQYRPYLCFNMRVIRS